MRGGKRKGAGAPKKEVHKKTVLIALDPDLVEKTKRPVNRSGLINSLLKKYFKGYSLLDKAVKLKAIGLGHNPCQGCEGYYTREGLFAGCAVEADGGCEWIKLHDKALGK